MESALKLVAQELRDLDHLLVDYLKTPNAPTNQVIEHIFKSGGKRLRPTLFLLSSKLLNYNGEHKFPIACVCEYVHTASLLHDDVIDNSTLRRGKPTTNSIWGDQTAVLAGDLIYAACCRLMVKTGSLKLIDTFAECIRWMSESELFQLEILWKLGTTEADYNKVVAGKTAALFAASTGTPALLCQQSDDVFEYMSQFGMHLGYAFQIADDCLDYAGDAKAVGKAVVADIREGKITLPCLLGLRAGNAASQALGQFLEEKIASGTEWNEIEAAQLARFVVESGGLELAKQQGRNHCHEAMQSLENVKQTVSINLEAWEALKDVTQQIVDRTT